MNELKLGLKKREVFGKKAQNLIENDHVLGNIFGKGEESVAVEGDYREVDHVISEAGKNTPIELEVEGSENHLVLVSEVDRNNITQKLHHVAFQIIKRGQKVSAEVPVKLVGEAPATRENLILVTIIDAVEVEAIPSKLPDHFEISLETLAEVGDHINVGDIKAEDDVEIKTDPETIVAKIDMPRAEVEEEPEEEEVEEGEEGEEGEGDSESAEAKEESESDRE